MNDYMEKGKEIIRKAGPFRIAIVIVTGILLLVLSSTDRWQAGSGKDEEVTQVSRENSVETGTDNYREEMESQVKDILEKVDGVGAVDVMITLKASKEKVTLKDNSVNADKSEEETVLVEDENNNTSPYVIQEMEPEIEGIIVVCTGGERPAVQREIIAGISALFPVESHKIKVMKSKEAK